MARWLTARAPRVAWALSCVLALAPNLPASAASSASPPEAVARSSYRLDYASSMHSDVRALFGMTGGADNVGLVHDVDSQVQARFEQAELADGVERVRLVTFRDVSVTMRIDEADGGGNATAIASQLEGTSVLLTLDADGLVRGLRFGPEIGEPAKAYIRTLLAAVQFSRPPRGTRRWETREDDQAGTYLASYARSGKQVTRARIAYLPGSPPVPGSPTVAQVIEPGGSLRASFSRAGELVALDGTEMQRVLVAGKEIASGTTTVQLRRLDGPVASPDDGVGFATLRERLRAQPTERLSDAATGPSSDAGLHRNALGDATLQSLLGQLIVPGNVVPGSSEATALYLKLKALVFLHPGDSGTLVAALTGEPPGSPALVLAAQALAAIGHTEAQSALVSLARVRAGDPGTLVSLVPLLGTILAPSEPLVETLQWLATDNPDPMVRSTARLAFGTLARRAGGAEPVRAATWVGWLRARLAAATDPRDRRGYLLALGNAAGAAALPDLRAYARDPSPDVRAAAMSALRWLDAAEARGLLAASLVQDTDSIVRQAAAQALGAHAMDARGFALQRRAFASEREDEVRIALLENIWAAVDEFPEARAIVETARQDDAKAVREAAARLK